MPTRTRHRLIAYATILALVELGLFAFCVAGSHGLIVPLEHQPSTDFVSFHAAGALADAGTPWLAYDHAAHHAAEQAAIGGATQYNYFYYPPVFLLLCAPLALLPYLPAFVLFQAVGAGACLAASRLIRADLPVVVMLAFPGLWWAIGTGQNALLTAALFAAGTAWVERRPWLAGVCLGLLCYKPHVGLMLPVALIAGGHWRVVVGAGASAVALIGASVAWFGVATWIAFLNAAAASGDVYAAHAIFMGGMTSPYGALMAEGVSRQVAVVIQALVILGVGWMVARVWRSRARLPIRAAVLLTATPVAVPLLMFYDLMLVWVALVWLSLVPGASDAPGGTPGWTPGWTWGRILTMAAVFMGPLLSGNLASPSHWPLACLTATGAFALAMAMAREALGGAGGQSLGPGKAGAPAFSTGHMGNTLDRAHG